MPSEKWFGVMGTDTSRVERHSCRYPSCRGHRQGGVDPCALLQGTNKAWKTSVPVPKKGRGKPVCRRTKNRDVSQVCWHTPVIPALREAEEEKPMFETSPGYSGRPCLKVKRAGDVAQSKASGLMLSTTHQGDREAVPHRPCAGQAAPPGMSF